MRALVDSCVFLDVFSEDPRWFSWSSEALMHAANTGSIVVDAVIYAEISIRFDRVEELEALLPPDAFLAGKCFLIYRQRGGKRSSPLPNLFIGAHAAVARLPLITRDHRRFRDYFPQPRTDQPIAAPGASPGAPGGTRAYLARRKPTSLDLPVSIGPNGVGKMKP